MSSVSANAFSVVQVGVVRLPNYELLPTALLKGLEDAASAVLTSNSVAGDLFNMSRATIVPTTAVAPDAIILVPLFAMDGAAVMDSCSLAAGPMLYIRLDGPPQPRAIFGTCIAYSEGAGDREVELGALVQFPPPPHLLVAKPSLGHLIDAVTGIASDNPRTGEDRVPKRVCIRQLEEDGELLTDSKSDNSVEKGMSKYILDLDGNKHATRNKSDIAQREKDLAFAFRSIDSDRWEYVMGTDYLLQPGEYKTTIAQQGRLRADHRHKAFSSCGYFDRIQGLEFPQKTDMIKLLITGQIMVEGGVATLTLEDFSDSEILSTCTAVCPEQNRPLVVTLKNIQTALQVYLSAAFEGVFDSFIADLEGVERPMELVSADFLKYSVEETLRKFFRAISTERKSNVYLQFSVSNPEECALYISHFFDNLSMELSNHQRRAVEEEYYRMQIIRERRILEKFTTPTRSPTPRLLSSPEPKASVKTCAGHLGHQLKATYADGRLYKCAFGKGCKFKHVGKTGKTPLELLNLISVLPAIAKEDLTRAVKKTA